MGVDIAATALVLRGAGKAHNIWLEEEETNFKKPPIRGKNCQKGLKGEV